MPPAGQPSLVDQVIDGRYRVLAHLADGGMASVYVALDQRLDRQVAFKVLRPDLVHDPAFAARFRREARSAARLSHPNVVGVFDQGQDEGHMFLAMELVRGKTLRQVLHAEGPLTPRAALDILDPVLQALAAAHDAGLIHRDVKPENVILREDGVVKVADFGLARAVTTATSTAQTGVLLGTVSYLSPEQVERGVADARSDVYAAGLLLFEMLTGEKAFSGDSPIHVAYQHVHSEVRVPSAVVPGLSPELDSLVARAAARDPEQRPKDAGAFLELVRHVHEDLSRDDLDLRPGRTAGPQGLSPTVAMTGAAGAPGSGAAGPGGTGGSGAAGSGAAGPGATGAGGLGTAASRRAEAGTTQDQTTGHAAPHSRTAILPVGGGASRASGASGAAASGASSGAPGGAGRAGGADGSTRTAVIRTSPAPSSEPDEAVGRRRWLVPVLVLAAVTALALWLFTVGPLGMTTVPRVAALSQQDAQRALSRQQLNSSVEMAFSETVQQGFVISSTPGVGADVRRRSTVLLAVSKGPERYAVPSLAGRTLADATDQLTRANLTAGPTTDQFSEDVPEGQVVSTDPAEGTPLKRGTPVALVLSKGREPITVASWVGKPAEEAVKALTDQKLTVDATKQENSDTVPKGSVISQDPPGGILYQGDKVTLVVSEGPVLVQVPSVTSMQERQATRTLQAAGFKVAYNRFMRGIFGTVRSQNPSGGTMQPKGSTVTLVIV